MIDPKIFIRNAVEALFDDIGKNPQLFEQTLKSMFTKLGIESSLDAVLCYIMGMCMGTVTAMAEYAVVELNLSNPDDLIVEMMDVGARRIIELKQIMISQRLHE